jgi:beta-xylosidase
MKQIFFPILLVAIITVSCKQKQHSFTPGELWPDNNGQHINAHGGGILFSNGKYYWFGEHKSDSTSRAMVGVTCYSSTDLYNWKNEGVALSVVDDEKSDITKGCVLERPKVVYNKETETYVMWFHLELKGQGYNAARVGLATSKNITGPYQFVRSYRPNAGVFPIDMTEEQKADSVFSDAENISWTPEWLSAVERGLFIHRDFKTGQMSRDMTVFVDDDQKAYHIFSSEDNLTLHIAELSDDYQSHTGKYMRLGPAKHNEAPALFKKNGTYFLITSGCTGWKPNAARMFSATNIWGPWTSHPNPCVGDDADLTFHSQSTFVLPVEGKKDSFIFMADRWTPEFPSNARYIWLPILFENGLPVLKWQSNWKL